MTHRPDPIRNRSVVGLAIVAIATTILASPLSAQPVEVTASDPSSAEQGTLNLDVAISGNGFGKNAVVAFLLAGTENPGGIQVKNVRVRGSKKLIANIDIDLDAIVSDFDIRVESFGRVGKGTELFAVLQSSSGPLRSHDTPVCVTFRDDDFDAILSDAQDNNGDNLVDPYCKDKKNKTYAHIGRAYGQFRLITNTSNKVSAGRTNFIDFSSCVDPVCDPPFPAGFPESTDWNTSRDLDLLGMANGSWTTVAMSIRFYLLNPGTEDRWEIGLGDKHPPNMIDCTEGEPVLVTRLDDSSWTIEASNQEACLDIVDSNGLVVSRAHYTFPFELTIMIPE